MDPSTKNISPVKAGYWYCKSGAMVGGINCKLFTHLFAAFAEVNKKSWQVTFPQEFGGQFQSFTFLAKQSNPQIQTILSIGGGGTDPSTFAELASKADYRQAFIDSSLNLARYNNFSGLSLNWQYPNTSEEMDNLGTLLTEWQAAVKDESKRSGNAPLLLTAAVFYSSDFLCLKYPIKAISDSLDWIEVMGYDMYTPNWSPKVTGPPAPLFNPTSQLSVDTGVRAWIHAGVPTTKLVLGLPFLGRSWLPVNSNNHGIHSLANGAANTDPIPYVDIISMGAEKMFDPSYVAHYCNDGKSWIGYEDKQSIYAKVKYAKKKELQGYIAWYVDNTDKDWTLAKEALKSWDDAV